MLVAKSASHPDGWLQQLGAGVPEARAVVWRLHMKLQIWCRDFGSAPSMPPHRRLSFMKIFRRLVRGRK